MLNFHPLFCLLNVMSLFEYINPDFCLSLSYKKHIKIAAQRSINQQII